MIFFPAPPNPKKKPAYAGFSVAAVAERYRGLRLLNSPFSRKVLGVSTKA